jgi:hypothetical protein
VDRRRQRRSLLVSWLRLVPGTVELCRHRTRLLAWTHRVSGMWLIAKDPLVSVQITSLSCLRAAATSVRVPKAGRASQMESGHTCSSQPQRLIRFRQAAERPHPIESRRPWRAGLVQSQG